MDYDRRNHFGRTFEQFETGDVYKHWPGKTITESDNNLFSLLTMNHMPLHIDANYSAQTQHGKILVVGLLVLSLAVGMSVPETSGKTIAALDYEEVKHIAPTFIGDTIYAQSKVLDTRLSKSRPDRGIIKIQTTVTNQRGEEVMTFKRSFMVPTSPPSLIGKGGAG